MSRKLVALVWLSEDNPPISTKGWHILANPADINLSLACGQFHRGEQGEDFKAITPEAVEHEDICPECLAAYQLDPNKYQHLKGKIPLKSERRREQQAGR